jgi:hypothetical protein
MAELGYGLDLVGSDDLTATMDQHTDPNSPLLIVEAIFRMLETPLGGLIDDEHYGHDVREILNTGHTDASIASAANEIRAAVERDDRVLSATVTVTPGGTPFAETLSIDIRIEPADPTTGAFTMTLLVTSAEVILEAMAA